MPTSAEPSHPSRTEELVGLLSSPTTPHKDKLRALRDLKNQIIGNPTKKRAYLKLGAVPSVVSILSAAASAANGDGEAQDDVLIQSAAAIGSFACNFYLGAKAVLDAGAFDLLSTLIAHRNDKVADASARSLKLIYQSNLAPKYDLLQKDKIEFLISLLSSKNENVSGLGASIIAHSCKTSEEKHALSEAGIIEKLVDLLGGSLIQRDASLESLAAMVKDSNEVSSKFMGTANGRALDIVFDLTKDKFPRTRLLACNCLISIRNTGASYLQDSGIKKKLVTVLYDLLDDPGQVGDEAPFILCSLISEKEDMQQLAFDCYVLDKLCEHLREGTFQSKRSEGILLALARLCSKLECCRERFLQLEVLNFVTDALCHDDSDVGTAACELLMNVTRSVKSLSAGEFMKESVATPLVQLLCDSNTSVQIAALGAISNVVVDFLPHKSVFTRIGGLKLLVQLAKSMESAIRINAVWALKNLAFLISTSCKEELFLELTASTLASLISDPEASVQEQALTLVRNLVDGDLNTIKYVFVEDGLLLNAIGKQLRSSSKAEVLIQGMYSLSNVASGDELHKEAVMNLFFPQGGNDKETCLRKCLQSNDSQLRLAAVWALVNLTLSSSPGARDRVTKLRSAGVVYLLKNMADDPCLDVKLRVKTALLQIQNFGEAST